MSDSRPPLEQRIQSAKNLAASFEKKISEFTTEHNRFKVPADLVVDYVTRYLSLFSGQEELRKAPYLLLQRLQVTDKLELPSAGYPSIEFNNCTCVGGLELGSATIYGTLTFKNLTDNPVFSATFTNVTIESQFQIKNCHASDVFFHTCALQDLLIESSVQRLRIDQKSIIRGNCRLSACRDTGICEVEFGGPFTFTSTGGGEKVEIMNCMYSEPVTFAGGGHAIQSLAIQDTAFHKGLRFGPPVSEDAVFRCVKFFFRADFQNTNFHGKTSFDESEFHCAPEFFGATLFPDTAFQKAKFLAFDGESEYAAYRELRHLSHNMLKSAQDESRFFAYEQRALANVQVKTKGKRLEGYLSKLYRLASNYGQSIMRPFSGLIGINAIFAFSYDAIPNAIVVADEATKAGAWHTRTPESVGLMLQNLFQPFAIFGKAATYIPNYWQVALLSGLQTVLSLALFALFFLAIRRRFRKGSE